MLLNYNLNLPVLWSSISINGRGILQMASSRKQVAVVGESISYIGQETEHYTILRRNLTMIKFEFVLELFL